MHANTPAFVFTCDRSLTSCRRTLAYSLVQLSMIMSLPSCQYKVVGSNLDQLDTRAVQYRDAKLLLSR